MATLGLLDRPVSDSRECLALAAAVAVVATAGTLGLVPREQMEEAVAVAELLSTRLETAAPAVLVALVCAW